MTAARAACRPRRRWPQPASPAELFFTFNRLALQGFGGVLAVAQRELVERQRWLTRQQFVEMLALSQVLPGPNVVNLALMLGDRFFGWRGALAALGGMLLVPLVIVLALAARTPSSRASAVVAGALRGMGAVAAGLVIATAFKLIGTLRSNVLGLPLAAAFAVATFVMIAWLRWPLVGVVAGLGSLAIAVAWMRWNERLVPHRLSSADLLGLFAHFLVLSLLADRRRDHHRARHAPLHRRRAPLAQRRAVHRVDRDRAGRAGAERAVRRRARLERRRPARRVATMVGTLMPSTVLALGATRWGAKRRETRGVRAFTAGLTPLTIGLLLATGWLLAGPTPPTGRTRSARSRWWRSACSSCPHQAQPDVAGRPRRARRRTRLGLSACRSSAGRRNAGNDDEPASARSERSLPWRTASAWPAVPRRRASSSTRSAPPTRPGANWRPRSSPGADRRPGAADAQAHRRGIRADPRRGRQPEDRPVVGRHRRPVPPGRRARPAGRLSPELPGRPARLGGAAVRDEPQLGRRLLHQRHRLRLERGSAEEEEPAAAEMLDRPARPAVQGRDRDLAPRLERHRLHHPGRAGADDGRGRRRSTT